MRVGSLCTGYGGIELGLMLAGEPIDLRWYAEIEPALIDAAREWHPAAPNLGDIRTVEWAAQEPVDLVVGGIPCQPTSNAGRRLGDADPRWLWPATRETLRALRPARFLLENVRGLVSYDGGRLFEGILSDLNSLGYDVRWLTLGACAVGLAHHRHRVFVLATLSDAPGVRRLDVAECGLPRGAALPSAQARDGDGRGEGDARYWVARAEHRRSGIPLGAAVGLLPTPTASDRTGAGVNTRAGSPNLRIVAGQPERWGRFAAAIARQAERSGPPPEPTEPNRNGAPRLRPEFVEWLMAVPARHVTGRLSRKAALKALGNGVSPPQLAAAWHHLTHQVRGRTMYDDASLTIGESTMDLGQFAELLRTQGEIKRNNKRDPRFTDIPSPLLLRLAGIAAELAGMEPAPAAAEHPVRELSNAEALAAMAPIQGNPELASIESVDAVIPAHDLANYGFRAPWPAGEPNGDAALAWISGESDSYDPPARPRDPFVSPHAHELVAVVEPAPKESRASSESAPPAESSASPSPTTEPSSKPPAPLMTPSIAGGGEYVRALTITPPPQPPPFAGDPADYEPGNHYGPGLPASEYPTAPGADPKGEAGILPAYRLRRSVTQLLAFNECGLRYRGRYVDGLHETPAWWSIGGLAFHEVARTFELGRAIGDGPPMSEDAAAKLFAELLDRQIEETIAANPDAPKETWRAANDSREGQQWWFDRGGEMAAQYVKAQHASGVRPITIDGSPVLEFKMLSELGGVPVVGYLDRLDIDHAKRRVTVVDYKTGSRMPSDPLQLQTYGDVLARELGFGLPSGYELWGSYWNARQARYVKELRLDVPEQTEVNAERFAQFDSLERAGVYVARPSDMACSSCQVRATCPIMANVKRPAKAKSSSKNLEFTP